MNELQAIGNWQEGCPCSCAHCDKLRSFYEKSLHDETRAPIPRERLQQKIQALPSIKDTNGEDCVSRAVVLELLR